MMIEIKVLGPGCPNCLKLEALCKEVVAENKLEANIQKITNTAEFWEHGIMLTPGLVVNGKILVQGKLPTKRTLENWLLREASPKLTCNHS
jgi:small redox-active disulfide protein 2